MKLDLQEPRRIELVSAGAHRVRKDARSRDDGSYLDVPSLGLVNSPLARSQFASRTGHSARAGSPKASPTPCGIVSQQVLDRASMGMGRVESYDRVSQDDKIGTAAGV